MNSAQFATFHADGVTDDYPVECLLFGNKAVELALESVRLTYKLMNIRNAQEDRNANQKLNWALHRAKGRQLRRIRKVGYLSFSNRVAEIFSLPF